MKAFLPLVLLGAAALGQAQTSGASPVAETPSSSLRLIDRATTQAIAAFKAGKKVQITVDNRSVAYEPRLIGKMVYVPVRFFQETGQRVLWDGTDLRATVRQETGPKKNSIEYDARRGQSNFQPGPSMRPVYQKGRLWVPLASGLASFNMLLDWVPGSSRLNVRTAR